MSYDELWEKLKNIEVNEENKTSAMHLNVICIDENNNIVSIKEFISEPQHEK